MEKQSLSTVWIYVLSILGLPALLLRRFRIYNLLELLILWPMVKSRNFTATQKLMMGFKLLKQQKLLP